MLQFLYSGATLNTQLDSSIGSAYTSRCQITRVVTESWCLKNAYCASCDSNQLTQSPTNAKAVDFSCPRCNQLFQLKSSCKPPRNKSWIPDTTQ